MRAVPILIASSLLAASTAGGADAAPSCRDSKGLYTPCAGMSARTHDGFGKRTPKAAGIVGGRDRSAASAKTSPARDASAKPAKPVGPGLIGRGRSCRDSKGLYKPC